MMPTAATIAILACCPAALFAWRLRRGPWSVDASLRQSWFLAVALALIGGLGWWIIRHGGKEQPVPAEAGTGRVK